MKVKWIYGKILFFIFIDTGLIYNFFDKSVVEKLKCIFKLVGLIKVIVVDGYKLGVLVFVEGLESNFYSIIFTIDFMLIFLGGCDMVSGV